jgi:hypothetical protein
VAVAPFDGSYRIRIIERAVIANAEYRRSSKFLVPMGLDAHPEAWLNFNQVGFVMDIRTLLLITKLSKVNKLTPIQISSQTSKHCDPIYGGACHINQTLFVRLSGVLL